MESFITWLLVQNWQWGLPLAVALALFAFTDLGKIHKSESNRRWWTELLDRNTPVERYRAGMGWLLDRIDARLSRLELASGSDPARIAWSVHLASFTMVLAVTYPIVSFLGTWIAGAPLRLGSAELSAAGSGTARLFVGLWIVVPLLLLIAFITAKSPWRPALFIPAMGILFGGMMLFERFDVPGAGAVAGAVAVAVTGAVAVVVAGAVAGAFVVAVAGAFAVAGAGAFAVTGAVAGAVTGVVALAVAGAFAKIAESRGSAIPLVTMQSLMLVALAFVALRFWHPESGHEEAAFFFLFLGVLPLFNALADFASLGLTRYLLRKGLSGWTVGEAVLDLLGGVAIFAALGMALISYLHWVVPANGLPLLDLTALFDDLDQRPEEMWWLAIMMLSTLLPTALHLSVAIFTILLQYPRWLRDGVIRLLDHGARGVDSVAWMGSAAICAMITASLWLPVLGFYHLFAADHGWLLDRVISFFRGYACLIGALPESSAHCAAAGARL